MLQNVKTTLKYGIALAVISSFGYGSEEGGQSNYDKVKSEYLPDNKIIDDRLEESNMLKRRDSYQTLKSLRGGDKLKDPKKSNESTSMMKDVLNGSLNDFYRLYTMCRDNKINTDSIKRFAAPLGLDSLESLYNSKKDHPSEKEPYEWSYALNDVYGKDTDSSWLLKKRIEMFASLNSELMLLLADNGIDPR
ncbi:MAG: hypothetical protein HEEMFOPI_01017 [Holosporales bacterium]